MPAALCAFDVLFNCFANLFVSDGNEFWSKKERIKFSTVKNLQPSFFKGPWEKKMIKLENGGCGKALKCVINTRKQLNMKIMNFALSLLLSVIMMREARRLLWNKYFLLCVSGTS
jgi:hypothetical protein